MPIQKYGIVSQHPSIQASTNTESFCLPLETRLLIYLLDSKLSSQYGIHYALCVCVNAVLTLSGH